MLSSVEAQHVGKMCQVIILIIIIIIIANSTASYVICKKRAVRNLTNTERASELKFERPTERASERVRFTPVDGKNNCST